MILISLYIASRLTRPIRKIEQAASKAVSSGYELDVETKQEFREVDSLANSINNMLNQIRLQMTDLEDELVRKNQTENERRIFINNGKQSIEVGVFFRCFYCCWEQWSNRLSSHGT